MAKIVRTNVSLPKKLYDKIKRMAENRHKGINSVSAHLAEAASQYCERERAEKKMAAMDGMGCSQ